MKYLSWLKEHKIYLVVAVVAAFLPAYGLRFRIGPFPTTALEMVLIVGIIVIASERMRARQSPRNTTVVEIFARLSAYGRSPGGRLRRLWPPRNDDKLLTVGSTFIIIATVVGIFVAPNKLAALGIARAYFWEPMIFAWLLIASKPDKNKLFKAALCGMATNAVVIIGYAIFQYVFPQFIPATYFADRRVTSFYSYPNAIALYLAPLAPLFLGTLWSLPIALFACVAIILAQSAGGLVAVSAAFFAVGLMTKKLRMPTIVVAMAIGAVLVFAPQPSGLRDQILMRDWSGRVHKIGWEESWNMLKEHPVFGAGLSGYPTAVAPYHTAQGIEIFQYPHNLFLATWSEIGLTGLIGLILVIIWFFLKVFRWNGPWSMVHGKFLAAAMIAILVHGLVDVPYFKNDLSVVFWLLAALVAL